LQTLPAYAGLPRLAELLTGVFGSRGMPGTAHRFKEAACEWNLDVLASDDPVRLQIEHRRQVEEEGERQTQARIADMREHARAATAGVSAQTLAAPPKLSVFGKWFGSRPSVVEQAPLTDNVPLEQARAALSRASANYI
jgi:hypothetical protein